MFGWPSIDETILASSKEQGGAGLSLHETTRIFSWASSISMVSSLLLGILLDAYGPRICSMASSFIVALGCWVFASSQEFGGFAFGACLIAFGGPGIGSSIIHIANLFPENENLAMSCLGGSVAMSFSVFAVFGMICERFEMITFRILFDSYILVLAVSAMGALWLFPDESFEPIEEEDMFAESELLTVEPVLDRKNNNNNNDPLSHQMQRHHGGQSMLDHEELLTVEPVLDRDNNNNNNDPLSHQMQRSHRGQSMLDHDGHDHHEHNHHEDLHATVRFDEPVDSYLRDERRLMQKTVSFLVSEKALATGRADLVSLKDKPFSNQLFSAVYGRALIVFVSTCFFANFFVASLSTEVSHVRSSKYNLSFSKLLGDLHFPPIFSLSYSPCVFTYVCIPLF